VTLAQLMSRLLWAGVVHPVLVIKPG